MPTSLLDKIRAALKRPTSTTAQLAAALADARQADAEARAAVERQVEVVSAGYLDPADKRAKARAVLADLRADAEDAGLILAEAERQHAAAVAADADAARRVAYGAAKVQADAAAADLAKLYPRLAFDLVALLGRVATAQQAAAAVNADLPAGFGPIADPEMVARGRVGLPRDVLDEQEAVLWGHVMTPAAPAPDELQSEIRMGKDGYGIGPGAHQPYFRRHRYVRREVRPAVYGSQPEPLADVLQLPAFSGGFVWELPEHRGTLNAADVLARVEIVEAAAVAEPVKVGRPVRVEWEDLGEVDPAERPVPQSTNPADAAWLAHGGGVGAARST